jgi:serine protease
MKRAAPIVLLVLVLPLSGAGCFGCIEEAETLGRVEGEVRPFVGGASAPGRPALAGLDPERFRAAESPVPGRPSRAALSRAASEILASRGTHGSLARPLVPADGSLPEPGRSDVPRFAVPAWPAGEDFVPGEVVVRLAEETGVDGNTEAGRDALSAILGRLPAVSGLGTYRFEVGAWGGPDILSLRIVDAGDPDRSIDHAETEAVRARLEGHPDLRYAEPNGRRWALNRPNDEYYGLQWHYGQLGLEAAWGLTTGSETVVVAVIDDGVNAHPDLAARLLPGYDMISDAANACHTRGRNADASQRPSCGPGGQSMWHGLHVAGTVGASTDNGAGVSGVDWAARILPVRVLGLYGGQSIDIIAGIHWAAGVSVPGVPDNPNPAGVINMSLGGGPLSQADQDAVNAAVARGAVVVVAAGNDDQDARNMAFAGYENVIVVGATDYHGRRAPYSNYGTVVDVMAPGGNVMVDANADGWPDGVLSTYLDPTGTQATFEFHQGTSMAAPHVAGVVALMKAVRPGLTHAEATAILRDTADPAARCNEGCGAGLVNPAAAILAAADGGVAGQGPARLAVSAERVNVGSESTGRVRVFNAGGEPLSYQASLTGDQAGRFTLTSGASGNLVPGGSGNVAFTVDRSGLPDGSHQALLQIGSNGGDATVALIFRVGEPPRVDVGEVVVATVWVDARGEVLVGGAAEVTAASDYRYSVESEPGEWILLAFADLTGDGDLGPGDLWGLYPSVEDPRVVEVEVGRRLIGRHFPLVPITDVDGLGEAPCAGLRRCWEACAGDEACSDACPIDAGCEGCVVDRMFACGAQQGCGDDIGCICTRCEGEVDHCFGPHACWGGEDPGGTQGVGQTCSAAALCAAPYACDTSVEGGYCTQLCTDHGDCPGGMCVLVDDDLALCLATCTAPGTCPRPTDGCYEVPGETLGACLP